MSYTDEQGAPQRALLYARRLAEIEPANPEVRQLVERLATEPRR